MTTLTLGQANMLAIGRIGRIGDTRAGRRGTATRTGGVHRTGAPVLRGSIEAGTFEDGFFAVPGKGETDRLLRMARAALDAGRRLRRAERSGERVLDRAETVLATISAGAVRVYEELLTLARLNRGRVFPSYDHLANATALGRATVARALAVLEAAGFLVRQRRFRRVEGDGPGPRYKQTSNVYRPALPRAILSLLPRWLRPAPIPDDHAHQTAERAREARAMLAGLSCEGLATATATGELAAMLARLGAAVDRVERESHADPQPLPHFIEEGSNGVDLAGQPTDR